MKTRSLLALAPLLAAVAACGNQADRVSAATRPQHVVAPAAAGAPAATKPAKPSASSKAKPSTSTGSASMCRTPDLDVRLGAAGHAAGSTYQPLVFRNTGPTACTLDGFPGVSFVAPGGGAQVGAAASRSGPSGGTVTLAPGGQASALVQIVNYLNFPPSDCAAQEVSGLRVYPPGNTEAAYVAFASTGKACSTQVEQLTVRSMVDGATGQ